MVHGPLLIVDMLRWLNKTTDELVGFFLAILLISIAVFSVNAAKIIDASDNMSRLKVGMPSNHAINFVTPSGVAEGQTVTLTFPSEFTVVGMTEDDVDFMDNGLPVTTAPDCSGTEAAAATWSGNTLTLMICPGDGGAIAPGSTIGMMVGTNALNSGIGVNRVTNPVAAGAYRLLIGGTFGDSGAAPVAIAVDDEVGVTACVGEVCSLTHSAAGKNDAGPIINQVPQATNIKVTDITPSTATITWQTDVISNSYVIFGLNAAYDMVRGKDSIDLYHSVTIMGLPAGTTFNFRVRSMSTFGEVIISNVNSFTTLPKPNEPAAAPKISDIAIQSLGGNEVTIVWSTDTPTYSQLEYGRTDKYGAVIEAQQFTTQHTATISNLSPATLYHYRITAIDQAGGQSSTVDAPFITFDSAAPVISNIRTISITPNSFELAWQTNKPAVGGVKFGVTDAYISGEAMETGDYLTGHALTINGLKAGTVYHYKIFQTDKNGNDAQSADLIVSTLIVVPSPDQPEASPKPVAPPANSTLIPNGTLPLKVDGVPVRVNGNTVNAYPGGVVTIKLPDALTTKPISNAKVQVGNKTYQIISGPDGTYGANVKAPNAIGNTPATIVVNYNDHSSVHSNWTIRISTLGSVYEVINGENVPMAEAKVTIFQNGLPWDGSALGLSNSQLTAKDGTYRFYLPPGEYAVRIEKAGYITLLSEQKQYFGPVNFSTKILPQSNNGENVNKNSQILKMVTHVINEKKNFVSVIYWFIVITALSSMVFVIF